MKYLIARILPLVFAPTICLLAASAALGQATITIQNADTAGVGFNDPTPATPVGGNSGTTVGQQRLIAFQAAANIWGAALNSAPTIVIRANWAPLTCTASSGTLGSAGNAGNIWRDFPGAVPGFWYGNALANAISSSDRNGGSAELNATFNVSLGTTGCLETLHWYYGLDNNHGSNGVDLVTVLMHEFAHGLGFQTFTSSTTGQEAGSQQNGFFPSIFDRYLFDATAGKTWAQMTTDAERVASAVNTGRLAWNGPQVLSDASGVLSGTPRLRVNSPATIAGNYQVGTADFGPTLSSTGITAAITQAVPNDGCSAFGISLSGKIALVDRGNCTFVTKTRNAQNAGAIGVIIVDNVSSTTPPSMGGGPDNTLTIPTVSVTQSNGNTIKGQLAPGVNATLFSDRSVLAGADASGRPLMFAPNPVQQGSSVSHWDSSELPNQLMEPNISSDLLHVVSTPNDLTFSLLKDIGWTGNISPAPTIVLEQGTTIAAVVDSVTRERGPFTVLTTRNFSADAHRRLIIFTSDLGLSFGDTTGLSVQMGGIPLAIESAGPVSGLAGTSFIVVRLPDLAPSNYALTVTFNGVNSTNAPTITIVP
jgi:PA domain-containing protein